jgi:hypothetical protein
VDLSWLILILTAKDNATGEDTASHALNDFSPTCSGLICGNPLFLFHAISQDQIICCHTKQFRQAAVRRASYKLSAEPRLETGINE